VLKPIENLKESERWWAQKDLMGAAQAFDLPIMSSRNSPFYGQEAQEN
jgi:hypothetical protein